MLTAQPTREWWVMCFDYTQPRRAFRRRRQRRRARHARTWNTPSSIKMTHECRMALRNLHSYHRYEQGGAIKTESADDVWVPISRARSSKTFDTWAPSTTVILVPSATG